MWQKRSKGTVLERAAAGHCVAQPAGRWLWPQQSVAGAANTIGAVSALHSAAGDASHSSEEDASHSSEGDASHSSEGDASHSSEGDASHSSEGDASHSSADDDMDDVPPVPLGAAPLTGAGYPLAFPVVAMGNNEYSSIRALMSSSSLV